VRGDARRVDASTHTTTRTRHTCPQSQHEHKQTKPDSQEEGLVLFSVVGRTCNTSRMTKGGVQTRPTHPTVCGSGPQQRLARQASASATKLLQAPAAPASAGWWQYASSGTSVDD
jgi:hypothetical protein